MDRPNELFSGELTPLVGVDDFRRTMAGERLLQDIDGMAGLQGDGDLGRQHFPADPVNHAVRQTNPLAIGM
jgi:hypothetical protein